MKEHIQLNGEAHPLGHVKVLTDLLSDMDLMGKRLAVEHNGNIVPRSLFAETQIRPGDVLEILQAVGGG